VRFVDDQPTCNLTDTLIEAIDENTAVVAVSSVQYATGTVVDISRLRRSTAQVGARLIVDATQAAGAMRVDAAAWDADAVVASGYKWLGGTEALHSRSCRHFCLSKYPLYRVGWAHRIPLDLMRPQCRWLMMPGAIRNQQCRMPPWLVSR
jgi:Selenocysteine lyase